MKTNLSEIIFILDRSGSMSGLESDTIGGYNAFLKRQRSEPGDARITTILFDDRYELLHNGLDIRTTQPITGQDYFTRGSTALLDAVGTAIHQVDLRLSKSAESEKPAKVIFVITTDGLENSSKEYTYQMIHNLITRRREQDHWDFIFLGANIDAEGTAENMGIKRDFAVNYSADSIGTAMMFESMQENVSRLRKSDELDDNWKKKLTSKKTEQKVEDLLRPSDGGKKAESE